MTGFLWRLEIGMHLTRGSEVTMHGTVGVTFEGSTGFKSSDGV